MAIIYTYPNLPLSSLSADDLLVITNVDATNNNPTKSVTLADIATYVTGTGSGTGTTNKIVKFTDGANGLLGDSIMTESTGLIDLAGQFVSTSSPTLTQAAPVSGIKAILNGTTAAPNVALYGDSKHTGGTQADSNYGLYAKGEFEGTGGFTGFAIGGNLEGRYDGTGTNGANASVYGSFSSARATSAANGTISYMIGANNTAKIESANVTAANLQGAHTGVNLTNGTAGDVIVQILDFDGTGGTVTGDLSYLQIQNDTMPTVAGTSRAIKSLSVLPSLFTGQVEIPLVPTINAHATSKQYVDQQISNVVSGLVFISTWDASSTPGGSPDLTDASTKVVGHYYVVSVAGSATPNGAGTLPNSWNVGDWCIYVEQGATDRWEKLDQTFVSGAGAAGQVTYWNSQNEVAGDNDLFFDSTNKRLGIGTTSPSGKLDVVGSLVTTSVLDTGSLSLIGTDATASAQTVLTLSTGVGNATGPNIVLSKSRSQSFGATVANDALGTIQFQGGNGTASVEGASISAIARDTFSGTSRASDLLFSTTPTGSTTIAERMRISQYGDIFISPRATSASSGSGILYFKNVDDNSATINGGSIRTVDSVNNPSGADMRFQVADDNGTLFDMLTIISSGFVGIGNMSPDVTLDVLGSVRSTHNGNNYMQLESNSGGGVLSGKSSGTVTTLVRTYGDSYFNGGSFGIGTSSPAEKLHVFNEGTAMIKVDSGSTSPYKAGIEFLRSSVNGGRIYNDGNAVQVKLESDFGYDSANPTRGGFMFKTAPATSGTLVDAVRIDAEGKVGIGTSSPQSGFKLDINGNVITRGSSYVLNDLIHYGSSDFNINASNGSTAIKFETNSSERMRITSSGVVGIGTDGPFSFGTGSESGVFIQPTSYMGISIPSSTTSALILRRLEDGSLVRFYNSNATVGNINVSGSSTVYATSSDYRLKKDLKDFDGLDKVSKIPVYDFKWKVDDSSSYGVMAHELQEVLPDAVSGEKDGEEMQGVDYSKIVPLLIKSIQELEAKVKILENK